MICSGVYPFLSIYPPFLRYYIWYRFKGSGQRQPQELEVGILEPSERIARPVACRNFPRL